MSPRAPTFTEVFREALEARLGGVHVCLPARVEAYDPATQTADCKPAVRSAYRDVEDNERVEDYPVLPGVPVACARAGRAFLHMPLKPGHFVTLVFSERGFQRWRDRGGIANPDDMRLHGLTGAIAMPVNLYPSSDPLAGLIGENLSLGFDDGAQMAVKPDGTIALTNGAGAVFLRPGGVVALGSETPADDVATAAKVAAQLDRLNDVLTALQLDMVGIAGVTGGIGFATSDAILALRLTVWPASVASSRAKVDP